MPGPGTLEKRLPFSGPKPRTDWGVGGRRAGLGGREGEDEDASAGWAAAGQARGGARVTTVPCQAVSSLAGSRQAGAGLALLDGWVGAGRAGWLPGVTAGGVPRSHQ